MSAIIISIITWILRILLGGSILGTLVIPTFFSDKMIKQQTNYIAPNTLALRKRLGRLSLEGKLFIICALLSVLFGWILSYLDDQQKENHFSEILQIKLDAKDSVNNVKIQAKEIENRLRDSLRQKESKEQIGMVQDTVSDLKHIVKEKAFEYSGLSTELKYTRKENMALQRQINSPFIEEYEYPDDTLNPHLKKDSIRGVYEYCINYSNTGSGKAINLHSKTYFLGIGSNNVLYIIDSICGVYDDTSSAISEKVPMQYIARRSITDKRLKEIVILAYELKYQNIFKEEKEPYRRVFLFDINFINKHIPKIPKDVVKYVHSYLVQNNYWRK